MKKHLIGTGDPFYQWGKAAKNGRCLVGTTTTAPGQKP